MPPIVPSRTPLHFTAAGQRSDSIAQLPVARVRVFPTSMDPGTAPAARAESGLAGQVLVRNHDRDLADCGQPAAHVLHLAGGLARFAAEQTGVKLLPPSMGARMATQHFGQPGPLPAAGPICLSVPHRRALLRQVLSRAIAAHEPAAPHVFGLARDGVMSPQLGAKTVVAALVTRPRAALPTTSRQESLVFRRVFRQWR